MPTIYEDMDRRQLLYSLLMPVMNLYVPGLDKGKGLYFLFVKAETKTPGGLLARPVLTSYYKSEQFKNRPYDPYNVYTSPNETILCADSFQSMYAQMLCGLIMREEVLRVGAVFASGLLRAIKFLQINWKQLVEDISSGTLNPKVTDHSYIPTLEYYSAGLPMACTMYASSECYFGLNLKPMSKPSEFLIQSCQTWLTSSSCLMNPQLQHPPVTVPHALWTCYVEVGKEYELVITTYSGLYRYRVGDILRVTGFYNKAPQFRFVRRKNVLLSIDSDKTDEAELQKGHYVIYWELFVKDPANSPTEEVLNQCCLAMEESLNSVYRQGRVADNSIGPLEIRVVKNGTFEELMDYAISRGASINQYKVPRCVSFTPITELLDSRVVSKHFSPSLPHWTPERRR
ncbi:hypothetical protein GH714_032971 [Hevea brasiliensis]|uniref:Uncharacterized protein n=1 Tax=Hevea brasiliensis TaxID=3981 RepID=A0A6A6L598_HEVBR|nr:hypothetical protein GH714_032971 [Hevea brasiliensis]